MTILLLYMEIQSQSVSSLKVVIFPSLQSNASYRGLGGPLQLLETVRNFAIMSLLLCRSRPKCCVCAAGTSGMLTFFHVSLRFQEFQITIEGVESDGTRVVLNQRAVRLGEKLY